MTSPQPVRTTHQGSGNGGRQGLFRDRTFFVPFDGWSRELDYVLADLCKQGRSGEREAMCAIREQYPQISLDTIWARIKYLGLTTFKRPPYRRHEWTADDLEVLRAGYRDGRNGASRTIDYLLERHPDWSRSVICWKAKSLGLSHKRKNDYQRWSENADRQLISCEGFQMESIESRLKRSRGSIRSRLAALHRGADFFGGFQTKELMDHLHLDEATIRRLERQGILKRMGRRITGESLKILCKDHPEIIPFETLDADWKHKLVKDYEYKKPKRARQGGRKRRESIEDSPPDLASDISLDV